MARIIVVALTVTVFGAGVIRAVAIAVRDAAGDEDTTEPRSSSSE